MMKDHRRPPREIKPQVDYKWSRSLSERARGMKDGPLGKAWKSRRERKLQEIEAIEAVKWLRAAGFPQYGQMYEDHQFPVDITSVEKDHDFLDQDSMQSLFRRLNTLNKCSTMKIEAPLRKSADDSDDEDTCALSDNWRYQRSSRRWSRKDLDVIVPPGGGEVDTLTDKSGIRSCSSHDSVITDNDDSLTSQQEDSPTLQSKSVHGRPTELFLTDLSIGSGQPSPGSAYNASLTSGHISDSDNSNTGSSAPMSPTAIKRSASEKFKSARNTFFKRMESLKSRKGSVRNRPKLPMGKIEIGSPVLVETKSVQERMNKLGCKEITPSVETSPNLSTSSRNTNDSCTLDNTMDNDSVFIESQISDSTNGNSDVLPRAATDSEIFDKRRNYSESAVENLSSYSIEDHTASSGAITNGYLDTGDRYHYRTGSFTMGTSSDPYRETEKQQDDLLDTHSLNIEEFNNNIDKPVVKLRNRDVTSSGNRQSVYDNVPLDAESDAVKELDMIVQSLMQDISELNASWGLTESGTAMSSFPMDLSLDEAIQDFSDKENTLTRKSGSKTQSDKNYEAADNIPFFPVDGTTNIASSRSSSSSTISHSNSMVTTSSHYQSTSCDQNGHCSERLQPAEYKNKGSLVLSSVGNVLSCDEVESSHLHVVGVDDTLDSILRNLESHYGCHKQRTESQTTENSSNVGSPSGNQSSHIVDRPRLTVRRPESNDYEEIADPDSRSESISNPELSDTETTPESREEDGSEACDVPEHRERRDSGVGSSLTREPSDRRRYRIRWHSFVKSHRPSFNSRDLQINGMAAGQLKLLRKFSLLKITALMEKYSLSRSGWNWVMPMNKFMRRFKVPTDYKERNVFGVPLQVILQRTGQALPQCMLHAMRCLRKNAHDSIGIFRKSGVRSRIQKLRDQVEAAPESVAFDTLQAYDVADLLKQYFRELPECLLTNKLSETFINIFTHVPTEQRQEALYAAVMLLPDENREVLQSLLLFLSDMADYADLNQMNASNLAVCFAPSLFHLCGSRPTPGASPKRNRKKDGIPDQRELQEQKAAHECLTELIVQCKKIFMVPGETLRMCHFSYMDQCSPVSLHELGRKRLGEDLSDSGDYTTYLESCIQGLLKESRDKFKGWMNVPSHTVVDLAYKKIDDGYSLKLWKCSVEVEAPPYEVLTRVLRERQLWDEDLLKWRVVESLNQNMDVFQYVLNSMAPHPTRDFCEVRHWRTDLPKGACVFVSTSIEHNDAPLLGGVRAVILASRYLIEPCGSGKSRLTHISRVDLRGHTPEWYNKVYGHLSANHMRRVKDSFCQDTEGPETNV